jgi:hypothetical protein
MIASAGARDDALPDISAIQSAMKEVREFGPLTEFCSRPGSSKDLADLCADFHAYACANNASTPPDGTELEPSAPPFSQTFSKAVAAELPGLRKQIASTLAAGLDARRLAFQQHWPLPPPCDEEGKLLGKKPKCSIKTLAALVEKSVLADSDKVFTPNSRTGRRRKKTPSYEEKFRNAVAQRLALPADEKRIEEETLPAVKKLILSQVEKVPDPERRRQMRQRIEGIVFAGTECGEDRLEDFFQQGAFFTRGREPDFKGSIRFCKGSLAGSRSAIRTAFILAHEISHSIDPCNLPVKPGTPLDRKALDAQTALPEVVACLRSTEGPTAKWDASNYDPANPNGPSADIALCWKDQISETFADWMAGEVFPDYLRDQWPNLSPAQVRAGLVSIVHSLKCRKEYRPNEQYGEIQSRYVPESSRINRIMLANERTRQAIGCGESGSSAHCRIGMDASILAPPYEPMPAPSGRPRIGPGPGFGASPASQEKPSVPDVIRD